RLEPGRYTVILEPQAVERILSAMTGSMYREIAEGQGSAFTLGDDEALGIRRSKLGLKIVDERVTISHDFTDPELGHVLPWGFATEPITWIRRGVLETLMTQRYTAVRSLNEPWGAREPAAFRMSGGETSVDEMIRTTKRGLLVTRFDGVRILDSASLLCTGLTRDGLWLIENGRITKAVKNFRFTESPLFLLNSLEQLGTPVRVFRPVDARDPNYSLIPAIVPPLKARDFSFTSLVDAV
ncbi:MAG TPA: metallopeptidase TldD-related protein, partial [Gemmatimonadaceae bacterium]|nr:metallopeptidase TldD-related protein [Gemmatimonadaceae bacterium]